MRWQVLCVLQSGALAAVRCADAQTSHALRLVCPGEVPREQVHPAHVMGVHWLLGLLRADWLGLLFSSFCSETPQNAGELYS